MAKTLKNSWVTVRVPKNKIDLIELASTYQGTTLNQFLMNSAYQEAIRVIEEEERLNISQETANFFFSMLNSHPENDEKLTSLAAKHEAIRTENGNYQHNITKRVR